MSRRKILSVATRKGLTFETLDWDYDVSRGGNVWRWEVELDEATIEAIEAADPAYRKRPDLLCCSQLFLNADDVVEWLNRFPDIGVKAGAA